MSVGIRLQCRMETTATAAAAAAAATEQIAAVAVSPVQQTEPTPMPDSGSKWQYKRELARKLMAKMAFLIEKYLETKDIQLRRHYSDSILGFAREADARYHLQEKFGQQMTNQELVLDAYMFLVSQQSINNAMWLVPVAENKSSSSSTPDNKTESLEIESEHILAEVYKEQLEQKHEAAAADSEQRLLGASECIRRHLKALINMRLPKFSKQGSSHNEEDTVGIAAAAAERKIISPEFIIQLLSRINSINTHALGKYTSTSCFRFVDLLLCDKQLASHNAALRAFRVQLPDLERILIYDLAISIILKNQPFYCAQQARSLLCHAIDQCSSGEELYRILTKYILGAKGSPFEDRLDTVVRFESKFPDIQIEPPLQMSLVIVADEDERGRGMNKRELSDRLYRYLFLEKPRKELNPTVISKIIPLLPDRDKEFFEMLKKESNIDLMWNGPIVLSRLSTAVANKHHAVWYSIVKHLVQRRKRYGPEIYVHGKMLDSPKSLHYFQKTSNNIRKLIESWSKRSPQEAEKHKDILTGWIVIEQEQLEQAKEFLTPNQ